MATAALAVALGAEIGLWTSSWLAGMATTTVGLVGVLALVYAKSQPPR